MNKERKVIEPGTIIYFDRNVKGEELRDLSEESLIIVINGDLTLKEDFYFEGDLYVIGNITGKVNIFIEGNICCNGEISVKNIEVTADFEIHDDIAAQDISVDGDFFANDSYVDICTLRVAGSFYAGEISTTDICVGEDFYCESVDANGSKIEVAGDFECTRQVMSAAGVTVLGKLHVEGKIEADVIDVG